MFSPVRADHTPQIHLHKGCPSGSLRHNGVFVVWQFVQTVGTVSPSSDLGPPPFTTEVRSGVLVEERSWAVGGRSEPAVDFFRAIAERTAASWIRFVDAILRTP